MKATKETEKKPMLSIFREYLFFRGLKVADVILVGVMAALLLVCWLTAMPLSEVFTTKTDINLGYSAKQDAQGLYYVVDNGHRRLLCFGDDAQLRYSLDNPTDGKGGGLYIDDFALDGGLTYLSASESDGMMLSKELIAVFDGKRYVRTIAERDYSGMLVNKHRFYGVTVQNGELFYIECEDSAIVLHRVALDSGEEQTERVYFDNAFDAVGDCTFRSGAAYILSKNGTITVIEDGKRTTAYSTRWTGEENRVPYRIAVRNDGAVCFTDIRAGKAMQSDIEQRTSTELCEHTASQTVNFTADGEGVLYMENDGLRIDRGADSKLISSLAKPAGRIVLQSLWFAAVVALVLIGVILLIRAAMNILTRKYGVPQQISFWVLAAVGGVSLLLTSMLMSNLSSTYRERLLDQMESDAYIVAKRIPAGTISQIRRAEDFDGDEYQTLCEVMNGTFLMNLDMNRQLYCTIQRLDDNMEQGFAVAYLNQSNGVYYPMDEVETEEVRTVYRTNAAVWDEEISNVSGTYVSVKVPVLEKGEVCGVVSVGSETSVIESMITRLQIQIIMSIVVILLLIWLITSEIMAWFTNKALYKNSVAEGDKEALPGHLIRLLVFAVFACYNMSATFLPVWILRNSGVFPESSREFMSSLPITVNIFVIGTMSLFTAGAVRRLGIKTILLVSTACSLIGNLLMFLFPSYYSIFGGLIISGIGVGLITNALNVMLTYIRNEENRQWGFTVYNAAQLSGVNFGMLLGSLLAVAVGQRPVFLVVAIAWLLLMLTGNLLVRQLSNLLASDSQEGDAQKEGISTARFLFNKPVLSFIVLMQNPYIIFNSFVMFYVPLFCGNNGFDETIVSILILVYSEVAIMTGDMLTQRMTKLLGNFGMYAAFATNILAVLVFALTRNMLGIVLALLMMGTAAAYGKTMQQTWFLKQTPVQRYGEDRAMGVYNFTENIGESLGPIVFGSLMAQNPLMAAVAPFCAAMATLGSGHLALNFKELRKK